jgi:hypothetical protein
MGLDDKFDVSLDDLFRVPKDQPPVPTLKFADIAAVVRYEIPIIHWRREKVFPLYTHPDKDGVLHWRWG